MHRFPNLSEEVVDFASLILCFANDIVSLAHDAPAKDQFVGRTVLISVWSNSLDSCDNVLRFV